MFDYSNISNSGLNLISQFGRDITYRTVTEPTYDFDTGINSGAAEVDTSIKAVITNYKAMQIDGEVVRRGDRLIIVSAQDITPEQNDIIVDGGASFKIIDVEAIHTGDTPVIYKLQVRK